MRRYQEMGEVRFIWAELGDHHSQIQMSAVVQAMVQKDYIAIVRTVDKINSPPKVGVCKPVIDADQLHYLYWVQVRLRVREIRHSIDRNTLFRCHLLKTRDPSTFRLSTIFTANLANLSWTILCYRQIISYS